MVAYESVNKIMHIKLPCVIAIHAWVYFAYPGGTVTIFNSDYTLHFVCVLNDAKFCWEGLHFAEKWFVGWQRRSVIGTLGETGQVTWRKHTPLECIRYSFVRYIHFIRKPVNKIQRTIIFELFDVYLVKFTV